MVQEDSSQPTKSLQQMQKDIFKNCFEFFNSNVNILCTFYYRMTVKKKKIVYLFEQILPS